MISAVGIDARRCLVDFQPWLPQSKVISSAVKGLRDATGGVLLKASCHSGRPTTPPDSKGPAFHTAWRDRLAKRQAPAEPPEAPAQGEPAP